MSGVGTQAEVRPLLEALNVHKHYGAVVALRGASLTVRRGEIMGLVGDNGAGKSTLVKILSGAIQPTSGSVIFDSSEVTLTGPADALELGIETVYQDLALVEPMTPLQNLFLGKEVLRSGVIWRAFRVVDRPAMRRQATVTLDSLGARIPSLDGRVENLSGGQRQAVAIARALLWGRQIVILDEPTAALGVRESQHALETIVRLRSKGVTVLVISHNIQQLMSIADRVTVMRLGKDVAQLEAAGTDPREVVEFITGANLPGDDSSEEDAGYLETGTKRGSTHNS